MAEMAVSGATLQSAPQATRAKQAKPVAQPRNSVTRPLIETVASRSVAIFGLLFGAQTLPIMLAQSAQMQEAWLYTIDIAFYGGLLLAVIATTAKRFVRTVNVYIAFVYLASMITWPLAVTDPVVVATGRPWLWFMCTVATAAAAIALEIWAATAYLFAAPIAYGLIRVTPSGGGANWGLAALDTAYAIILGGAVLIIITLLRSAAASVDSAQAAALARYSHAVRQHAIEVERVQVDAIVHDSVLTTLLSAARAFDEQSEALAASMAQSAMVHLKDAAAASPDDESTVPLSQLSERIIEATTTLSVPFTLRTYAVDASGIPAQSAEAVYSAAVQAMLNSLQHAGSGDSVTRWLTIRGTGCGGLHVQVGDTGRGFSPDSVPVERMGLRISIIERVTNAGGRVGIDSTPGGGTVIDIEWPAPTVSVPPESVPTVSVPPESAPTGSAPPASAPPESAPTGSVPPESAPTGSVPPESAPTVSVPPDSVPPASVPPASGEAP